MNVSSLKEHYCQQLENDFSVTEIELIFNLLIENYLEVDRVKVEQHPEMELNNIQQDKFEKALLRIKKHEPIQYIIGETTFFGRAFKVNAHVHVPRQESITMVEWVLEDFQHVKSREIHGLYWILERDVGFYLFLWPKNYHNSRFRQWIFRKRHWILRAKMQH